MQTTDEKITALKEKAASKRQKLSEANAAIEQKKATVKALNAELDGLAKKIFELETQRLFELPKGRNIDIDTVVEAVSAGLFDDSGDNNDCAINSTENTKQEENTDETGGSGKTVGNA